MGNPSWLEDSTTNNNNMSGDGGASWLNDSTDGAPRIGADTNTDISWADNNNPTNNNIATDRTITVQPLETTAADTTPTTTPTADDNNNNTNSGKENLTRFQKLMKYDKNLLFCMLVLIVIMNIPKVKFVLYPFMIFSTWIHEFCHAMASLLVGNGVQKLHIYKDGSGRAYTYYTTTNDNDFASRRGFVASAGYTGTAVIGCLLLLLRRIHKKAPMIGNIIIAAAILITIMTWVRNTFGICMLLLLSCLLLIITFVNFKFEERIGKKVSKYVMLYTYSLLASTCSLNAVDSIADLFQQSGQSFVNGDELVYSDAHTVADNWGGAYWCWAGWWFIMAIGLTFVGLFFAIDPIDIANHS